MNRAAGFLLFALVVWMTCFRVLPAAEPGAGNTGPTEAPSVGPSWHTDYAKALEVAKAEGRMMFVFFCQPGENNLRDYF